MLRFVRVLYLFLAFLLLNGCAPSQPSQAAQPTVIIVSPPSGSVFQVGQVVTVQSTSADSKGIVRVELLVDGTIVHTDASPGGQSQIQLSLVQTWTASGVGSHLVVVRATNPAGATGQAAVNVTVQEQIAQNPSATPAVPIVPGAPTNTLPPPAPTATNISLPPPPAATNTRTPSATLQLTRTNTQPPNIPDWPLVRQGDQGNVVTALQYLIRHAEPVFGGLSVDGIFGLSTRNAVISFQTGKGLAADGIVGPKTWSALIQGATIRLNSTGDEVRAAQHLLRTKFKYDIAVDGIFGAKTDTAVKDFQSTHHLSADGIVGPMTWQALVAIR